MTAPLDDEVVDLRRANAELQRRLNEALAERDESLRRETATTEVLQIINSSPGDLTPVFQAILEKASRLCEATHGHIWKVEGQHAHAVALRGDPNFVEWLRQQRPGIVPGSSVDRLGRGEPFLHVLDCREMRPTVPTLGSAS
jgi:hypothetical protein